MGRFIAAITAVKFDVIGIICRKSNVVAGVNGMPALILRAYHLRGVSYGKVGTAGHMALVPRHVGWLYLRRVRRNARVPDGCVTLSETSWAAPMPEGRLGG